MSLNLSNLGSELDSIRRARRGDPATPASGDALPIPIRREPTAGADAASVGGASFSSTASLSPASMTRPLDPAPDAPANLCLLCFARHPSAVLLPCCHLNLCYLCAPLFMQKGATESRQRAALIEQQAARERELAAPAEPTEEGGDDDVLGSPPRTLGRIPFNVALSRAVKNHPKSRRLSIGGYVAPPEGFRGGELRGRDVLCGAESSVGLTRVREGDGRVVLGSDGEGAAQCLVCRAGVSGWLRVYS